MIELFLALVETPQDREKFTKLYRKYANLVYWVANRRLGNHHLCEECVQETFMYIAKNFHNIGEIDHPRTKGYVATIADGTAIKIYRKEHRGETDDPVLRYASGVEDFEDETGFDGVDEAELSAVIDKVLDDDEKTLVYLKYVYGYKLNEISKILGESYYETRKRLCAAVKKLKDCLEEAC